MITETKCAPPNSILLIMGSDGGIPESIDRSLVAATSSCLAVGTLSETDGETTIVLTDGPFFKPSMKQGPIIFKGRIDTPNGQVFVCTTLGEALLTMASDQAQTKLQIWASDDREPNEIAIVLDSPSTASNRDEETSQ